MPKRNVPYGDELPPKMQRAQMDPAARRKYWGIKSQIGFRRRFPLSNYWYAPIQRGTPISLAEVGASYRDATEEQRAKRKHFNMTGRGKYAMTGRGGFFGRMLGGLIGQPDLGDKLGDVAWNVGKNFIPGAARTIGDAVFAQTDKMTGSGLYRGKGLYKGRGAYAVNNLITDGGATASSIVPTFQPTDLHEITYSNREYVRDIYAPGTAAAPASVPFSVQQWALNPGLVESFPWLSQIAINFEEYEILQLAYTYKSTVADFASASGQVGQVVMATQYNPNSDPFADKEEMMLYEGGMSCKTTESLIHGVECDPAKIAGAASKYVRVGSLPPTEDLKNYDLGRTAIAVLNCPSTYAGQQLGELWVSYTVKLRKPKFAAGNAYNVRRDVHMLPVKANAAWTQSEVIQAARNSLGTTLTINTTTLPSGVNTDDLLMPIPTQFPVTSFARSFQLRFPDSYSGCVRIRILAYNSTVAFGQNVVAVSEAPNTILRFQDIPVAHSIQTRDIPGQFALYYAVDGLTWSHVVATYNDANAVSGSSISKQSDTELHLRLLPAAQGLPNIISFRIQGTGGSNVSVPSIEVTQYNTFLSTQDNGSNDKLQLVKTQDGSTTMWA